MAGLEMLHDTDVERLLVLDLEVLRVLQDGEGKADQAGGHEQLFICPEQSENVLFDFIC